MNSGPNAEKNTFQIIVAMDGKNRQSFIMNRYHELQWSKGFAVAGAQVMHPVVVIMQGNYNKNKL